MNHPTATFRVKSISPPFDLNKKVEVTFEVVIVLGHIKSVLESKEIVSPYQASNMRINELWSAKFEKDGSS